MFRIVMWCPSCGDSLASMHDQSAYNEVGKVSPLPTVGGDVIYIKNDGCRLSVAYLGEGELPFAACLMITLVWVVRVTV